MILVDSSVWVDYLRGKATHQTEKLDMLLGTEPLAIGDLILAEVLQGCMTDKEFNAVKRSLATLDFVVLGVEEVAVEAAKNFRKLRVKGITVRKTIDTIIATRCIVSGYRLLHNDKDFDAFEKYLGPKCVNCETQRINSAVDAAMCVNRCNTGLERACRQRNERLARQARMKKKLYICEKSVVMNYLSVLIIVPKVKVFT